MYKNIIFDIGNVLLSFKPEQYLKQYYDSRLCSKLLDIIFKSDEWISLDLGHLLIDDVISILSAKHPEYSNEISFVLKNWTDMLTPIEEHTVLIKQLKDKGYNLYLLSNFHIEAIETVFNQYDFFNLFDGGIISGHVHLIKPDKEIYQLLLNKYNLKQDECVFIDDSIDNISQASALGILALHADKIPLLHQLNFHDIL